MNFKKIFINALLLLVIAGLLMFFVASHAFDDLLNMIGVGVPMWVFLILILLIVNIYYQSKILKTLQSFNNQESYPEDDQH